MEDQWIDPPTETNRCLECEVLLPQPMVWCHDCIKQTETANDSIKMYQQNGWSMINALRLTLLDVYDAYRTRGTADDHRFPR